MSRRGLKTKPPAFYRRPATRGTSELVPTLRGLGVAPMEIAAITGIGGTNASSSRFRSGLVKYQEDNDVIYSKGLKMTTTTADTQIINTFSIPSVVNPDGSVIAIEIMSVDATLAVWPAASGSYAQQFFLYEGADNYYWEREGCVLSEYISNYKVTGAAENVNEIFSTYKKYDLTDGGRGRIVTSPTLTAFFDTNGFGAVATMRFRVNYRILPLSTPTYIARAKQYRR